MTARARALVAGLGVMVVVSFVNSPPAQAAWAVSVQAGSTAQSSSQAAPVAPTGVTATCVGLLSGKITVTWNAVSHADSYTIYISSTASTGPFAAIDSSPSSPWTSTTLSTGGYWFAVGANIGASWSSPRSGPSGGHSILVSLACV